MSSIPCPICSKADFSNGILYCPDCGQSYHTYCWNENNKTCAIKYCNGSTKDHHIHFSSLFIRIAEVHKSEIQTICPQCTKEVRYLDRYCTNCEYEVNPPKEQKTFPLFSTAKWMQKHEGGLAILFIISAFIITSVFCGQMASSSVRFLSTPSKTPTLNSSTLLPTLIPTIAAPIIKPSSTHTLKPTPQPSVTHTLKPTSRPSATALSTATYTPKPRPQPSVTPQPTDVPRVTQPPPPASITCRGAPSTRLNVGFRARVTYTDGTPGSIRPAPASGQVIGRIPEGSGMNIIGGPQCDNNRVWWKVITDNGYEGWISEGKLNEYWLEPIH